MPDADTAPVKPFTSDRLVSLDLLRGLTVMGMILVNSMAGMAGEGAVYPTLLHAQWDGLTLADLVFPAFLFMVGVSIPLSLREKPGAPISPGEQHSRIIWRSIRLVLLGFILSNLWWFSDFEATTWRGFGVLQRIGLAYCACALLFLWGSSRTRMIIAGAILILYWPINLIPALDGLPNDLWQRGHNFVASVDRVLLGDHNYVKGAAGYDPEGLLGTLPAIAQGLIGVAIGEYMLRAGGKGVTGRLILAGVAMLVAGYLWGFAFPIVKDIWSSSFVLVTSGITVLSLAAFHWLFDGQLMTGVRGLLGLLILPFGVNAIAAYVLHMVTGSMLGWDLLLAPYRSLSPSIGPELAAFVPVGIYMFFIWLAVYYLWRRKWVVRI
jgi:predicted acyltransferase